MSRRTQITCASFAFIFPLLALGGMLLGHFLPPIDPGLTADQTAAFYREHSTSIRAGMVFLMFAGGAWVPLSALMVAHIHRMEGGSFTPLAWISAFGGCLNSLGIVLPALIMATAAYRPEADADVIRLASDLGWIFYIMNVTPALMQAISFGAATLNDRSATPLFPRWLGYFNLWAAFAFFFGFLVCMFKSGPFAWNGLLAFWLVVVVFCSWAMLMAVMFIKVAKNVEEGATKA